MPPEMIDIKTRRLIGMYRNIAWEAPVMTFCGIAEDTAVGIGVGLGAGLDGATDFDRASPGMGCWVKPAADVRGVGTVPGGSHQGQRARWSPYQWLGFF